MWNSPICVWSVPLLSKTPEGSDQGGIGASPQWFPGACLWRFPDVSAHARCESLLIRFQVEREGEGNWHVLADAVEATVPVQAVVRIATDEGRYRVRPSAEAETPPQLFWVPAWGVPEPVKG